MECLVLSTIYLKSDVIRHTFENSKPFFNIQEQDGIYFYRAFIILKMLFVFHTIKSIFPKYAMWVAFTAINTFIFCKYLRLAVLPASAQWFLFISPNKVAPLARMVLICVIAMNVKSYEFMLDLHVAIFLIMHAYKTYHCELQKLCTVICLMFVVSWYISILRVFSSSQLFSIVGFLFLAYIPLKPDKFNKYTHMLQYFYILMLMWIIFKFQSVNFRETQTVTCNFVLNKRWSYYKSKSLTSNDEREEKLVKALPNSRVNYISEEEMLEKSLISNFSLLLDNHENVCGINDENEKNICNVEKNVFESTQLPDDEQNNLFNKVGKVKVGYKSQNIPEHFHFKERKFASTIGTNVRNVERRDVQNIAVTFKEDNIQIYEQFNEIGISPDDENVKLDEQIDIDILNKVQLKGVKKDKHLVESTNRVLQLSDKNSPIKNGEKVTDRKTEGNSKVLMLKDSKDKNKNVQILKSSRKVAKFVNKKVNTLILDEEFLRGILDSTHKEENKNPKEVKSVFEENKIKKAFVAAKDRNVYMPILDSEKSMLHKNGLVKEKINIIKIGNKYRLKKPIRLTKYGRNSQAITEKSKPYENNFERKTRMVSMKKIETKKNITQESHSMFKSTIRNNNLGLRLDRQENVKSNRFIKQLVEEFLRIANVMQNYVSDNKIKKKIQEDESSMLERFKLSENIKLINNAKIGKLENKGIGNRHIHNSHKNVKHSKRNFAANEIKSRLLVDITKDRGKKIYSLENLLKIIQEPLLNKQRKSRQTKYTKYTRN